VIEVTSRREESRNNLGQAFENCGGLVTGAIYLWSRHLRATTAIKTEMIPNEGISYSRSRHRLAEDLQSRRLRCP
jgi:hypothetical protein